jgi:mRNA interferase MazF
VAYVPDAGDIVWLHFDPQSGHEQAGHRPALVLSPKAYNGITNLMICCPMTTKGKGHRFEVEVSVDGDPSFVLSDQVKSVDWVARRAKRKGTASEEAMRQVRGRVKALLGLS